MDYTVLKKTLFILTVYVHLTSVASHSLQYFCTGVIPGLHVPEFSVVRLVDGEQMVYYDSNIRKMIPKTEWMEKVDADNPLCWKKDKPKVQEAQESFKADMEHFMTHFNHTEGVHTVQKMYGCELHDDGSSTGYNQYGYDGEDFISLDLKTGTWTANHPKADIMKEEWERICSAMSKKAFLLNECIDLLQTYVEYGGSYLERKVHPEVSLFQKDSSSPVVCHATGFFPKAVMISWQKNGEDLHEDVELRETLPNQDGTFQKRSVLTVSPEELNRNQHSCVVQHDGLEREMKLQVSDRRVLRGRRNVFMKERNCVFRCPDITPVFQVEGQLEGQLVSSLVQLLLFSCLSSLALLDWQFGGRSLVVILKEAHQPSPAPHLNDQLQFTASVLNLCFTCTNTRGQ